MDLEKTGANIINFAPSEGCENQANHRGLHGSCNFPALHLPSRSHKVQLWREEEWTAVPRLWCLCVIYAQRVFIVQREEAVTSRETMPRSPRGLTLL